MPKPTLVIAGPGAGKTHDMVNLIAKELPNLNRNRVLAAITYTNSAADSIRNRLGDILQIPSNVFIGTTYSFFNRFIIQPYASIFEDIEVEKLFLDINLSAILDTRVPDKRDHMARNIVRKKVLDKLLADGHIPLSEIGRLASKIIVDNKRVRAVVCNRLQYLFLDEFQDIDTWQFNVFDEIRKGKLTRMYAVGDPEQYISSYTYNNSTARKPKSFDKIPINKFSAIREEKLDNRRSFLEIVRFTNQFHTELDQHSRKGANENAGVYFIDKTDKDQIISEYREKISRTIWATDSTELRFFYLSSEWKTLHDVTDKYGLLHITGISLTKKPLDLANTLLTTFSGLSIRRIREEYDLSTLEYRTLAVKLLRQIQHGAITTESDFRKYATTSLKLKPTDLSQLNIDKSIDQIKDYFAHSTEISRGEHFVSSIHTAKGLEADGVLVIAKTNKELDVWLSTDKQVRYEDKSDKCRIGYVAFTRAKQALFIACLQKINDRTRQKLSDLGVSVISQPKLPFGNL